MLVYQHETDAGSVRGPEAIMPITTGSCAHCCVAEDACLHPARACQVGEVKQQLKLSVELCAVPECTRAPYYRAVEVCKTMEAQLRKGEWGLPESARVTH